MLSHGAVLTADDRLLSRRPRRLSESFMRILARSCRALLATFLLLPTCSIALAVAAQDQQQEQEQEAQEQDDRRDLRE